MQENEKTNEKDSLLEVAMGTILLLSAVAIGLYFVFYRRRPTPLGVPSSSKKEESRKGSVTSEQKVETSSGPELGEKVFSILDDYFQNCIKYNIYLIVNKRGYSIDESRQIFEKYGKELTEGYIPWSSTFPNIDLKFLDKSVADYLNQKKIAYQEQHGVASQVEDILKSEAKEKAANIIDTHMFSK